MPTPVVHDPRQNRHGWWGKIEFVEDQGESKDASGSVNGNDTGVQHIFVKTSREAHFVAQGTAVDLEPLGETVEAVLQHLKQMGIQEGIIKLIAADLGNVDTTRKTQFHQIAGVDDSRTTPLARMHNLVTEVCFNNDHWLDSAGDIGASDIRAGRELPSAKTSVAATTT